MFNKTFVSSPAPVVHVHNETKPHDSADAARLYGELKTKAEEEVAQATVTRFGADNELSAVVVHTEHDFMRNQPMARVLFRLNGALYDLKLSPDANAVEDRVFREVAIKLVESIMSQMTSRYRLRG
jgi:hypothetical protein